MVNSSCACGGTCSVVANESEILWELLDELIGNSNPEGCNQYKGCDGGTGGAEGHQDRVRAAEAAQRLAKAAVDHVESGGSKETAEKLRIAMESHYSLHKTAGKHDYRAANPPTPAPTPAPAAAEKPHESLPTPKGVQGHINHVKEQLEKSFDPGGLSSRHVSETMGHLAKLGKDDLYKVAQGVGVTKPSKMHDKLLGQMRDKLGEADRARESVMV